MTPAAPRAPLALVLLCLTPLLAGGCGSNAPPAGAAASPVDPPDAGIDQGGGPGADDGADGRAAAAPVPAVPAGPTLGDVHVRWQDRLADADARFARWIAADPRDPVDTAAAPPGAGVPLTPGRLYPALLPPPGEGLHTSADSDREFGAYLTAQVAAWADERALSPDERAFLEEATRMTLARIGRPTPALSALAERVRTAGVDDPLVRAQLLWESAHRTENLGEIAGEYQRTLRDLTDAGGPPYFLHRVALWRLKIAVELQADEEAALDDAAAGLEAFARSLTPGSATLAAHPRAPDFLLTKAWDVAELYPDRPAGQPGERAVDRLDLHPARVRALDALSKAAEAGADPYAFHCFAGDLYVNAAWDARGGGMADSVADGAWEVFERRLAAAARHLHAAYLHRPDLPWAPTALITVAKGGAATLSPTAWFRRAVAAQVDYWTAYVTVAEALHPKWGGSLDRLVALADETLREDLVDTKAPIAGLEIVQRVADAADQWGIPAPGPWRDVLKRHAERYVASVAGNAPGWTLNADYPPRLAALHRWLARFGMTTERTALLRAWPNDATDLRPHLDGYRRSWALGPLLARQGPAADAAERLSEALGDPFPIGGGDASPAPIDPDRIDALREDRAAVARASASLSREDGAVVREWASEVATLLGWVRSYHRGRIVALRIEPNLRGFRCGGTAATVEDGVATLSGTARNRPHLSPLVAFPAPALTSAWIGVQTIENTPHYDLGIAVGPGAWDPGPRGDGPITGGSLYVYRYDEEGKDLIGWLPQPFDRWPDRATVLNVTLEWAPLQLLVRPDDVVVCHNFRFLDRIRDRGPSEIGPLRFGATAGVGVVQRVRLKELRVLHRPDFTLTSQFRNVPEELRGDRSAE